MRGKWNGLQALFLKECLFAYYVHCFAHRLQLALVAVAKNEPNVWQFFSHLNCVVNLITSSPKRVGELKSAQRTEVNNILLATDERQSGRGANQIGNLQRAGATQWSSHYESVKSMIDMYVAFCEVVKDLKKCANPQIMGQAFSVFKVMRSFDFIFILNLINNIMRITDTLCQVLQRKSQDIVNAMKLVSTTKSLLQQFREDGWDNFLAHVLLFCTRNNIDVVNMSFPYEEGISRRCQQRDQITIKHHYHFDIFNATIDFQLMELKHKFDDVVIELLTLSIALDPSDSFRSFDEDKICMLASKLYSTDFTTQDILVLRYQLMHFKLDVVCDPKFHKLSTFAELFRELVLRRKLEDYTMLDRLIRLVLTLHVSMASIKRAFSHMNNIKTDLRSSMGYVVLADCMLLNIERDVGLKIDLESVINDFESLKTRRAQFC